MWYNLAAGFEMHIWMQIVNTSIFISDPSDLSSPINVAFLYYLCHLRNSEDILRGWSHCRSYDSTE